ncbi:uncharacterized protein N7479_009941 [Penicillium vulpinum]|uniref:uncharacterized protein n=1 Tax=Penicillium vulpinum TaxID=29845 RepID=UPI002546EDBA|nr:uncharacterized protein N7479_009941 [Penicillium vulpinum]KAJ5951528.1 hypothetical protein N7479_009941 [Penicillium vulpinum]
MNYIFLCDNQYAVFYNIPPRFGAAELAADLPCSDELFEATTSIEYYANVTKGVPTPPLSLSQSVSTLLAEDWPDGQGELFNRTTRLGLFIVISVLHNMIWVAHNSGLGKFALDPIHRALVRWQSIWDGSKKNMTPQQVRELGFVRHSDEYCWLAKTLLRLIGTGQADPASEDADPWGRSPQIDLEMRYLTFVLQKYDIGTSSE